jgi:stress response protein SCP2
VAGTTWTVNVGWRDPAGRFDLDASALLLTDARKIRSEADFVFYNQRATPDRTVVHHGEQTIGLGDDVHEQLTISLAAMPPTVECIVVAASIDRGDFNGVQSLHLRAEPGDPDGWTGYDLRAGAAAPLSFDLPRLGVERAVLLAEFYRPPWGMAVPRHRPGLRRRHRRHRPRLRRSRVARLRHASRAGRPPGRSQGPPPRNWSGPRPPAARDLRLMSPRLSSSTIHPWGVA